MTFEEYADTITWITVAERTKAKAVWQYQQASIDGLLEDRGKDRARINELEDELHCVRAYNDELVANLKQIEDAIAFELGGEPCGLHAAHDLIKSMIKAAQEGE